MLDVSITNYDTFHLVEINGTVIKNVVDYEISTTAHGMTRFSITLDAPVRTASLFANRKE